MASFDFQCVPNDPRLVQVTQYLEDIVQGVEVPVPLDALGYLLRTKCQRMREKGVSNNKMQLYEYYEQLALKGEPIVYDFPPELLELGKPSEDQTIGDKEDPVFTESQLRAVELKKEAFALKAALLSPFMKMVVEDKEEVDTAPLLEQGLLVETGEIRTEFHSQKGKFPEPEILRNEILEVGVFREHIKDRLFTFLNVFTKVECDKLREQLDFSEEEQKLQGELLKTAISSKKPVVRTNIRRHFIDNQVSLVVWRAVKGSLPASLPDGRKLVGVRTKMNYYRYGVGQYFKTHIDGGFRFTATGETSEYSFIIYLNDDFEGGTTRFCPLPEWNNEPREVAPVQGGMLVFRQHDTKHCGVTVESGYKHILQGMVMYGPLRTNALGQPFGKEAQLFHTCEC